MGRGALLHTRGEPESRGPRYWRGGRGTTEYRGAKAPKGKLPAITTTTPGKLDSPEGASREEETGAQGKISPQEGQLKSIIKGKKVGMHKITQAGVNLFPTPSPLTLNILLWVLSANNTHKRMFNVNGDGVGNKFTPTYLEVMVSGLSREVCLDTSSGYSLISRNLIAELERKNWNKFVQTPYESGSLLAGKTSLSIENTIRVRFTLAGRKIGFTFAVIKNIDNIWVFGNDFRAEYEVSLPSIDCVELPWNKQVHCHCTPVHTRVFLTTREDKEYPARHKVVEKVQVNTEAAEGMLYNITPAANVNLCMAPGVGAKLKKGTLPICILNPKQETKRI
ncbi:hypothetical protein Pelo_15689 [Pelomyxa schiedti]|nr:hypothetical protein Pelo_15689 [Pelomyxa schiedti]